MALPVRAIVVPRARFLGKPLGSTATGAFLRLDATRRRLVDIALSQPMDLGAVYRFKAMVVRSCLLMLS